MSQKNELLEKLTFVGFDFHTDPIKFAGDQIANNKFDLGYEQLKKHPALLQEVLDGLCELAESCDPQPEFTVGVPDGATELAGRVALEMGIYCVHLTYLDETKERIIYKNEIDENTVECLDSGVIIEDVLNRRTSTSKVLDVPKLEPKVSTVLAILDRADRNTPDTDVLDINKPIKSLVTVSVPAQLDMQSEIGSLLYEIAQSRKQPS